LFCFVISNFYKAYFIHDNTPNLLLRPLLAVLSS
jgi:hypothetical protein